MKMNKNTLGRYASPTVLQVAEVTLERNLLAGPSLVEMQVASVGQEVETLDFSESTFNHTWEEE